MTPCTSQPAGTNILIHTGLRRLYLRRGTQVLAEYPVAVGKPSTPTPTGCYAISNKILNPGGVLGTRWMGLNIPGGNYGIHGTNNPSSIGKAVSRGCIRMYNHDVEHIFSRVSIGTPVCITDGRQKTPVSFNQDPDGYVVYTVQKGDTLWKISRRFGVTMSAIIQANQLSNPSLLYPGQKLVLPHPGR